MLSIRLKPALERRLSRLARQTGRTKTFYATKLIEENIEELEDRYLAEARLEKRGKHYSAAEVRRQLGLDDCVRRGGRQGPQETRSPGATRDSRLHGATHWPSRRPALVRQAASPQQIRVMAISRARLSHHLPAPAGQAHRAGRSCRPPQQRLRGLVLQIGSFSNESRC